jgi:hypothetical protein
MIKKLTIASLLFLAACSNKIETDTSLKETDKAYIRSLHLLDREETIKKFYSQFKNKAGGNFITNKRIAAYWINERDKSKNTTNFAYYPDIIAIDTIYNVDFTYNPYLIITRTDSTRFNVYVGGKHNDIKAFFEDAISTWKHHKREK